MAHRYTKSFAKWTLFAVFVLLGAAVLFSRVCGAIDTAMAGGFLALIAIVMPLAARYLDRLFESAGSN